MTEIALAYASADRDKVKQFCDFLREKGFKVFWDQDISPGENWEQRVRFHFDVATLVLVFLSANALKSNHVMHEAQIALGKGVHIPVLLEDLDRNLLPSGYSTTHFLAVPQGGYDNSMWEALEKGVKRAMRERPWVREMIAQYTEPLVQQIRELSEENEQYSAQISDLSADLNKGKVLFETLLSAINEVQLQSDRLTVRSKSVQESLQALEKYLTPPRLRKNKVN